MRTTTEMFSYCSMAKTLELRVETNAHKLKEQASHSVESF